MSTSYSSYGDMRFSARFPSGADGRSRPGIRYPSPFFDIGFTYMPPDVKSLFQWCRYYFYTSPVISAAVTKLASYPLTDLVFETDAEGLKNFWHTTLMKKLRLRAFLYEVGLDYFCYGNAFVSVIYPFKKFLVCGNKSCGHSRYIKDVKYKFRNFKYEAVCPSCGYQGAHKPIDRTIPNSDRVRLVRWNPSQIEIDPNPYSVDRYKYYLSPQMRNDILLGKKDVVETVPCAYIQAAKNPQHGVWLNRVFHFARPSVSDMQEHSKWGVPLILPVLKDTYYAQILRKAQEMIAQEHIVPFRSLYPAPSSGSGEPFSMIDLGEWKDKVEEEIERWRWDCVSADTMVETEGGLRRADEIVAGMQLVNHLGSLSAVEKVWRRPLREGERAWRVEARGLSAVQSIFSEGHPLFVSRQLNRGNGHKLGEAEMLRVRDLRVGDYVGHPLHAFGTELKTLDLADFTTRATTDEWVYVDHLVGSHVPEIFEFLEGGGKIDSHAEALTQRGWTANHIKTAMKARREGRTLRRLPRRMVLDEEFAWVLGLYTAEGSVSKTQVLIARHRRETESIVRLERFFHERFGASMFLHGLSDSHGVQATFSSLIAAEVLAHLVPGVSYTKRIPASVKDSPPAVALSFLRGMFDGDGCVSGGKKSYTTVSEQLAEDYRSLWLALGVPLSLAARASGTYHIQGKSGPSRRAYVVKASGESSRRMEELFDRGYHEGTASSRMGVYREGYFWHRIRSIDEVPCAEVFGFQLNTESARCTVPDEEEFHGTFCTWGMAGANSNHIAVFPIPLGSQTLGGDGRALMIHQELRLVNEMILAGLMVPSEFVFGGLSYSGTSLSMHLLKNWFDGYRIDILELVKFVMDELSVYYKVPTTNARLKRFHMADDLQRVAMLFQFNSAGKLSDETLLSEMDLDSLEEVKLIQRENQRQLKVMAEQQLEQAHMQGEAQKLQQRYAAQSQTESQGGQVQVENASAIEAGPSPTVGTVPPANPQLSPQDVAAQVANALLRMPEKDMLEQLQLMTPYENMKMLVIQELNKKRGNQGSANAPLPSQRPPQRDSSANPLT